MKKLQLAIAFLTFFAFTAAAQDNRVIFNFEGFAFNNKGEKVRNTDLLLKIWITGPKDGKTIVYEEHQTVSTDQNGLFFAHIGNGKVISGSMAPMANENNSRVMKIGMACIGETTGPGQIRFQCIKCRRSYDRFIPHRVEAKPFP